VGSKRGADRWHRVGSRSRLSVIFDAEGHPGARKALDFPMVERCTLN
jgi:hypothetical protein